MTREFMRKLAEPDRVADEAGGFVAFDPDMKNEPLYDYRSLSRYAREKGVEPFKPSEEERERFRIAA